MKNINEHNLKMNDVQGMYVLTDQEIDEISSGSARPAGFIISE